MKKKMYLAPEVKTVECKMNNIICASGQTEGFTVSSYSYDETDDENDCWD